MSAEHAEYLISTKQINPDGAQCVPLVIDMLSHADVPLDIFLTYQDAYLAQRHNELPEGQGAKTMEMVFNSVGIHIENVKMYAEKKESAGKVIDDALIQGKRVIIYTKMYMDSPVHAVGIKANDGEQYEVVGQFPHRDGLVHRIRRANVLNLLYEPSNTQTNIFIF